MENIKISDNKAPYRNSPLSCSTLTGFDAGSSPAGANMHTCENCNRQFETGYGKKNRFCSRSCCASFNAKKAQMTEARLKQLAEARSKIKKGAQTSRAVCDICGEVFEKQASLMNHVRWVHKEGKAAITVGVVKYNPDKDKKERICRFCGKTWNCFIWHLHRHEAECKQNPNRRIVKGHPQSEETKKKLSEIGRSNKYRRIMRHTQEYKGVLYDSSWEVEFAKRLEELGIDFERPKIPIEYKDAENNTHNYFPDFYIPKISKFAELKNPYLFNNDPKVQILKERIDIIWLTDLDSISRFEI